MAALLAAGAAVTSLAVATAIAVPLPKPRPGAAAGRPAAAQPESNTGTVRSAPRFATAASDSTSSVDLANVKEAIAAARKGNISQAGELQKTIADPIARKLVEWAILRSDDAESIELSRYTAFISENPSWPAIGLLKRRAEAT